MSNDLTTKILIQIRDGVNQLREEHGAILKEHGAILKEHGAILKEHGAILNRHGDTLDKHDGRLGALERQGEANGLVLKQILGAVEYGNKQRDLKTEQLYQRVTRIEQHLELPPLADG